MSNSNINVVVSGPRKDYTSTYKTYILRGGIPFADQVIMPDTKYVIKYDFDLGGGAFDLDFSNADTHTVAEVTYYYIPFTADGSKYTLMDDTLVFVDAEWNGLSAREIKPEKGTLFMIASITGGLHKNGYGINVVTVPENCILEFDGGSLSNGTIIGQDTFIYDVGGLGIDVIFGENITREGTWRQNKVPDKPYDPAKYSGLGRKTLELKEDGSNVLTQDDFDAENTIYVIGYDFDLGGKTIEIPKGCILLYLGGSISNGTLISNHTRLVGNSSGTFYGAVFNVNEELLNYNLKRIESVKSVSLFNDTLSIDGWAALQSLVIYNNYLVVLAAQGVDKQRGRCYIYRKNGSCLGYADFNTPTHSNGATLCGDIIYLAPLYGTNILYFNIANYIDGIIAGTVTSIDLETVNVGKSALNICYDDILDRFIGMFAVENRWSINIYDSSFSLIKSGEKDVRTEIYDFFGFEDVDNITLHIQQAFVKGGVLYQFGRVLRDDATTINFIALFDVPTMSLVRAYEIPLSAYSYEYEGGVIDPEDPDTIIAGGIFNGVNGCTTDITKLSLVKNVVSDISKYDNTNYKLYAHCDIAVYVDSSYTGLSTGSQQMPFKTIISAVNYVYSINTNLNILVIGGVYKENINVRGRRIVITGESSNPFTLQGTLNFNSCEVTLRGCNIENGSLNFYSCKINLQDCNIENGSLNLNFCNSRIGNVSILKNNASGSLITLNGGRTELNAITLSEEGHECIGIECLANGFISELSINRVTFNTTIGIKTSYPDFSVSIPSSSYFGANCLKPFVGTGNAEIVVNFYNASELFSFMRDKKELGFCKVKALVQKYIEPSQEFFKNSIDPGYYYFVEENNKTLLMSVSNPRNGVLRINDIDAIPNERYIYGGTIGFILNESNLIYLDNKSLNRWRYLKTGIVYGENENGSTNERPTSELKLGMRYFDTSLAPNGKPIWYAGNGTWVDANGETV